MNSHLCSHHGRTTQELPDIPKGTVRVRVRGRLKVLCLCDVNAIVNVMNGTTMWDTGIIVAVGM